MESFTLGCSQKVLDLGTFKIKIRNVQFIALSLYYMFYQECSFRFTKAGKGLLRWYFISTYIY